MIKWKASIGQEVTLRSANYINVNGGDFEDLMFGEDVQTVDNVTFNVWNVAGVVKPTIAELPDYASAQSWFIAYENNKKQTSKSLELKQYENGHITLIKTLLQLIGDPRGDLPLAEIPILSMSELSAMIEPLYDNPATEKAAVKLAMKLTNTNVTLFKLNGANWTDSAAYHSEIV
jgi:hypothetical protein